MASSYGSGCGDASFCRQTSWGIDIQAGVFDCEGWAGKGRALQLSESNSWPGSRSNVRRISEHCSSSCAFLEGAPLQLVRLLQVRCKFGLARRWIRCLGFVRILSADYGRRWGEQVSCQLSWESCCKFGPSKLQLWLSVRTGLLMLYVACRRRFLSDHVVICLVHSQEARLV